MRRTLAYLAGSTAVALFASTGVANASTVTLGVTTPPTGSTPLQCSTGNLGFPDVLMAFTQDPTTPYFVPAGGGMITSWSTNTTGDTAGATLTFVVTESVMSRPPSFHAKYRVVGADTETLPNPLPGSGVATFDLSTPIAVKGGDTIGIDVPAGQTCVFVQGSTPAGDSYLPLLDSIVPASGQRLSPDFSGPSRPGNAVDVGATLVTAH
jgi:hypothetical protein